PIMEVEEDPKEDTEIDIGKDEEDEWEEDDDWLMVPVIPPRAASFQLSTYEVGGPPSAVPEAPYPVGRLLPVVAAKEDTEIDIGKDEEDEWEEDDDWLMVPVIPPRAASFQLSTYEVGGPPSAVPEAPYPVGRLLPVVAARVSYTI
nr:hypothetical protein [Tanacetum cinerariifolium]